MSGILSPAVGVMNRLSVQGKLALLGLVAMVPVVVLAYMLINRVQGDIDFARKETQTVPVVMPARQLMQAVQAQYEVAPLSQFAGGCGPQGGRCHQCADRGRPWQCPGVAGDP